MFMLFVLSYIILNWEFNLVPVEIILTSCLSGNDYLIGVFINFIKLVPWSPLYASDNPYSAHDFIR